MNTEHTPAPWVAERGAGWIVRRIHAVERREAALAVGMTPAVGLVGSPGCWFDEREAEANARLMAAAPDLLEALLNIENDDGGIPAKIWAMRNAAIAKARTRE